jgi:hypothetical protein
MAFSLCFEVGSYLMLNAQPIFYEAILTQICPAGEHPE